MSLEKRFASPIKGKQATAKRAKTRDSTKDLADLRSSMSMALFCSVDSAKTPTFSFLVNGCSHHAQGLTSKLSKISLCNF